MGFGGGGGGLLNNISTVYTYLSELVTPNSTIQASVGILYRWPDSISEQQFSQNKILGGIPPDSLS